MDPAWGPYNSTSLWLPGTWLVSVSLCLCVCTSRSACTCLMCTLGGVCMCVCVSVCPCTHTLAQKTKGCWPGEGSHQAGVEVRWTGAGTSKPGSGPCPRSIVTPQPLCLSSDQGLFKHSSSISDVCTYSFLLLKCPSFPLSSWKMPVYPCVRVQRLRNAFSGKDSPICHPSQLP